MVALWAYHHHLLPITKRKIVIGCLISPSKTLMPFSCNNLGIFIVSMFVSLDYLSGCLIGISSSFTINHRENSLGRHIGVSKNLLPFLLQLSMFCWKKELVGPCRKWCGSARLKSVSQGWMPFWQLKYYIVNAYVGGWYPVGISPYCCWSFLKCFKTLQCRTKCYWICIFLLFLSILYQFRF